MGWTSARSLGGFAVATLLAAIFAVGQLAEANLLTPKLLGDRIHLHPVWVIFALFAGGTLYGFVGVLIAVPAWPTENRSYGDSSGAGKPLTEPFLRSLSNCSVRPVSILCG